MNILDFFATGSGMIGAPLRRMRDEQMAKEKSDILAGYFEKASPTPSIGQAFQPKDQPKEMPPAWSGESPWKQEALKSNMPENGGLSDYANSFNKPPQQVAPAQPTQTVDSYNRDVAELIRKGIPEQAALAVVGHVHNQRKAAAQEARIAAEAPKYMSAATAAFKSGDRASAFEPIMQLQRMGIKVPTEMLTWINPNYQRVTNDVGDKEINSAFNPANGQLTIGQVFNKGQSPDSAASNALNWAKFNYSRDRDALGDKGQTWQSRRGNKDTDDNVDPETTGKRVAEYRKFAINVKARDNGDFRSPQEIADMLNNRNYLSEWSAKAAAAYGPKGKQQFQNDVEAMANDFGLVYENGVWVAR